MRRKRLLRWTAAGAGLLLLLLAGGVVTLFLLRADVTLSPEERSQLTAIFGGDAAPPAPKHQGLRRESHYVAMRDGVRIAVDVLLPGDLGPQERVPAVFMPTRYWRSWDLRFALGRLLGTDRYQRMLVAHGYAVVLVDARGSGASFGTRDYPWSPAERQDYVELMDWAVAQPWCTGALAASGVSYAGTAAEFMVIAGHPALKAVIPQFSLYDTFADIAFPGGVFNHWFVKNWGRFNRQLDAGQVPEGIGLIGSLLVRGPAPVPAPDQGDGQLWGREAVRQAVAQHAANVDIYKAALQATFRDDVSSLAGASVDAFSPHSFVQAADNAPHTAWYGWGGWHDGAYARACISRFATLQSPQRAVIGPWNHGGVLDTSPFHAPDAEPHPPLAVQYLEQIRFLNHHLKGQGPEPKREIRYYTLGEGLWKAATSWPPPGFTPHRFYLQDAGRLAASPSQQSGQTLDLPVNPALGSGEKNRWRTQIFRSDVIMPPRPLSEPGVLSWTSAPLPTARECTGSPLLEVYVSANAPDGLVFAYLEDVAPDGETRYVTEAPFRLLQRHVSQQRPPYAVQGPYHSYLRRDGEPLPREQAVRLRFALLPVSWQFKAGHRVRLVLTGYDKDQFAPPAAERPRLSQALRIHFDAARPSHLELPLR